MYVLLSPLILDVPRPKRAQANLKKLDKCNDILAYKGFDGYTDEFYLFTELGNIV